MTPRPSMFSDDMTLEEARTVLNRLIEDGHRCPCCNQWSKVYRWSLYSSAARMLIRLYKEGGTIEFVESKTVKQKGEGGHCSQLRHWKLVEQEPESRPDGGQSGWWRVTGLGEAFLLEHATISKYVYVYDGEVLREEGKSVSIRDALGKKFNYQELINS